MTDRTPIIAPGTLPGRARAIRKAHDRRTRLARESRAASPAGRARPETASRDEYRVLRSKPSNISLTPQSTRLDLPLVPPRQRPGHTQQHIHRQRRLTEDPPYQIRHERDQRPPRSARPGDRPPHRANEGRRLAPRDACQDTDAVLAAIHFVATSSPITCRSKWRAHGSNAAANDRFTESALTERPADGARLAGDRRARKRPR